jgi:hypothetical protein
MIQTRPPMIEVLRPISICRSAVMAAVATSMLLVGCGSDESGPSTTPPEDRPSTSTTSETPAASPLEGTWRTGPVSLRDAEATLRRQGLARWIEGFRANPPFSGETVLVLSIEGGQWNLDGESEGKSPAPIDYDAAYEINGDTVTFHHSEGSNTHRWSIDGDTLRLQFVRGTLPLYKGVPDEVFQRALYMTAPFTREG